TAGRDHRRMTTEQVESTSFPPGARQSLSLLAVTVWAITGYIIVAMGFYSYAQVRATWAGPEWDWPLLVVGALIGAIGFGWLVGAVWPRLMSAVVVTGIIWGVDLLWEVTFGLRDIIGWSRPGAGEMGPEGGFLHQPSGLGTFFRKDGAWRFLIPSEYHSPQMVVDHVTGWAVLWMVGLGVVFFLLARWWRRRAAMSLAFILAALVIALAGGMGTAAKYDPNWGMFPEQEPPQSCTTRLDGALIVCLHPKQEALLPETADIVAKLLSPIAGRPWVPLHWESGSSEVRGNLAEGIALINFYDRDEIDNLEVHQRILMKLLTYGGSYYYGLPAGDYVVLTWLLDEAGISRDEAVSRHILPALPAVEYVAPSKREMTIPEPVYLDAAEVDAAVQRFLALSEADREAWLDAHWPEVFTGTLTLDDLP
ncbi:MAG TPA: hypothetical protein VNZ58_03230, partial [Thermomicrobiales bacterium]|nr:hypothetical protein [Thermomicrobiales bacterium]